MPRNLGDPHTEFRLVGVFDGSGEKEFRAGRSQARAVLRGGVDRDGEDGGGAEELLGCEDSVVVSLFVF